VLNGDQNPRSNGLLILNNSMANIGTNAMSAAIDVWGNYQNVVVKNNIASGMQYAVYVEDSGGTGTTFVSDYNMWNSSSGELVFGSSFQSYSQWQAAGRDAHGVLGIDPAWVAPPGNEQLTSGSKAIGAGVNLTSLAITALDSDNLGNARPSSGAWDIGAYEYGATHSGPPPPPPPPPATIYGHGNGHDEHQREVLAESRGGHDFHHRPLHRALLDRRAADGPRNRRIGGEHERDGNSGRDSHSAAAPASSATTAPAS